MVTRRDWIDGVGSLGLAGLLPGGAGHGLATVSRFRPQRDLEGNRPFAQMAGGRTEAALVGSGGAGLCRRGHRGRPRLPSRLR